MPNAVSTTLAQLVDAYDPSAPLERAVTIPSSWYTNRELYDLERRSVFGATWQFAARLDQLETPGRFVTANVAGEPIVVVRGDDGTLRAFYNVCRHHAAEVMTADEGSCKFLRCPYHAWTYSLRGELQGVPEFDGVADFDRSKNGLVPVRVETWENFVFVNLDDDAPSLHHELGRVVDECAPLSLTSLAFFERRSYDLQCNWKVYVDNYLDGGYHVPFLHKGLASVLDNKGYTIEVGARHCLQWSPIASGNGEADEKAVRRGDRALYYWIHPNFMLNWYEGVMDTNLVLPLGVDRCRVIFDFYFADVSGDAAAHNAKSVAVGERIQQEDVDICESVQRGLGSRAYDVGRLSVRREGGEQLFHRLLHADLTHGLAR
jgi:choline monooxygenase